LIVDIALCPEKVGAARGLLVVDGLEETLEDRII
jgi:hypothetical protein